ncbi:hypothetical protein AB395_00002727 [Sinorhizobium fredii CCBAU 45436]|nr:hypothetical protein AB395_00002727 [Sinorhizobium fredii CCBAU 45436]
MVKDDRRLHGVCETCIREKLVDDLHRAALAKGNQVIEGVFPEGRI